MADLPVWGIHVTTSSVRGLKLGRSGEGYEVLGHDQYDFAEDIEDVLSLDRHAALAHALFIFAKRHDFNRSRVVVSVDGSTAFNRFVSTPLVEGESMQRLLEYEAQQQIPFPLENVHWDHKVLKVDEDKNLADVMIFAVKRDVVEERLRRLQKVRFPADDLQLAPIALYNYAVHEGLAKDGVAVISVDYDRTDLCIVDQRRMWFRTLPTGVFGLVEAIREEIEPRHRQAVRIARGEIEAPDPAAFEKVRRAYAERLGSELARMVEYYRGSLRDVDLRGILLVPGSPMVPPLGRHLKAACGLDVFAPKGLRQTSIDPDIVTPEMEGKIGNYAHALGLALQGLEAAEVPVQLYEGSLERDVGKRKILWVASVVALFAIVGLMWWKAQGVRASLEAERSTTAELLERTDEGLAELGRENRAEEYRQRLRPLVDVGRDRLVPVEALDTVLAALMKYNEGRADDERIYLVNAATRSMKPVDGRDRRRELRLVLGALMRRPGDDVLGRMKDGLMGPMAAQPAFDDLEEVRQFTASSLSMLAEPDLEDRILRRRFQMAEFQIVYDAEPQP
jgi:type IV pilus assembly protein PilM